MGDFRFLPRQGFSVMAGGCVRRDIRGRIDILYGVLLALFLMIES